MSFTDAVKTCFTKYCDFGGRARRSEYWYFFLFNFVVSGVLSYLARNSSFMSTLSGLYGLAVLLPGLGVAVRRMHDIGKTGWYLLMSLIPIVGAIIVIVKLAQEGQPGSNQYGSDPRELDNSGSVEF